MTSTVCNGILHNGVYARDPDRGLLRYEIKGVLLVLHSRWLVEEVEGVLRNRGTVELVDVCLAESLLCPGALQGSELGYLCGKLFLSPCRGFRRGIDHRLWLSPKSVLKAVRKPYYAKIDYLQSRRHTLQMVTLSMIFWLLGFSYSHRSAR